MKKYKVVLSESYREMWFYFADPNKAVEFMTIAADHFKSKDGYEFSVRIELINEEDESE